MTQRHLQGTGIIILVISSRRSSGLGGTDSERAQTKVTTEQFNMSIERPPFCSFQTIGASPRTHTHMRTQLRSRGRCIITPAIRPGRANRNSAHCHTVAAEVVTWCGPYVFKGNQSTLLRLCCQAHINSFLSRSDTQICTFKPHLIRLMSNFQSLEITWAPFRSGWQKGWSWAGWCRWQRAYPDLAVTCQTVCN